MDRNINLLIRVAVIVATVVGALGMVQPDNVSYYVLLLLLFILNSQLRLTLFTGLLSKGLT